MTVLNMHKSIEQIWQYKNITGSNKHVNLEQDYRDIKQTSQYNTDRAHSFWPEGKLCKVWKKQPIHLVTNLRNKSECNHFSVLEMLNIQNAFHLKLNYISGKQDHHCESLEIMTIIFLGNKGSGTTKQGPRNLKPEMHVLPKCTVLTSCKRMSIPTKLVRMLLRNQPFPQGLWEFYALP